MAVEFKTNLPIRVLVIYAKFGKAAFEYFKP